MSKFCVSALVTLIFYGNINLEHYPGLIFKHHAEWPYRGLSDSMSGIRSWTNSLRARVILDWSYGYFTSIIF